MYNVLSAYTFGSLAHSVTHQLLCLHCLICPSFDTDHCRLQLNSPTAVSTSPLFRRSTILSSKLCVRSPWSGSQGANPSEAENLLAFPRRKEAKNLALGGTAQQFFPIDIYAMYISAACV